MDEDTGSGDACPKRYRATANASALGAAALLVLSFGPSALALTPSMPVTQSVQAAISAPASGTPAPPATTAAKPAGPRAAAAEEDDATR